MKNDPFKKVDSNTFYWSQFKEKGKRLEVEETAIQDYRNVTRKRSFDTLKEALSLWKVVLGQNISTTTCTCPQFRLYHNCKHVVTALLKLDMIEIPKEFSDEIIVETKKNNWRPKKASKALEKEDLD